MHSVPAKKDTASDPAANSGKCAMEKGKPDRAGNWRRRNHKEHEIEAKSHGNGLKCVGRTTGPCHKQIYCK